MMVIRPSAAVEIRDRGRVEHAKAVHPLRTEIDPRALRGGRDEEDGLALDERAVIGGKLGEEVHRASLSAPPPEARVLCRTNSTRLIAIASQSR